VAISIDELEHAAAPGWRGVEEERLGDWLLRAAAGFTGRANSALAAGDPGRPLPDAVDAVQHWYGARGLPAMIAVPYPTGRAADSELDQLLARRGWSTRADAATVMTAVAARVAGRADGVAARVDFAAHPDQAWLDRYHYRGQDLPTVAVQVLTSAPWQAFGSVRADGETIAIGRVAGSGEWAGLTAIEVDPACRLQGLGTAVTAALARHAVEQGGCTHVYLQVADDNDAARALYRTMGFADHHGYHYRIEPVR
jgi:ribosomal protein S18 acetylase RimI-like enzyme